MIPEAWLVSKVLASTNISQYSTQMFFNYIPETKQPPAVVYKIIGFQRNRLQKTKVYSLTCLHNNALQTENMNNQLYMLFDNSTQYIRESSSNLCIENVFILENGKGDFDEENKYYYRVLDIAVSYRNII